MVFMKYISMGIYKHIILIYNYIILTKINNIAIIVFIIIAFIHALLV